MVETFDSLVGALNGPMFIVTATDGERRAGCLVGFAGQCSINPPRFMVWLSKRNFTYLVAKGADRLAVHVPTVRERELATLFGSRTGFEFDKFARCAWHPGPGAVPLLADCPQRFIGRIVGRYDTGDHEGILTEPVDVGSRSGLGQIGFQDVKDIDPGNDA
jgi:flavin reductase (DIM6/NTAB) family NADH-FMN oxidoreductase RutF